MGLREKGVDDHFTIGLDEDEEFSQIHRKINKKEIWRETGSSLLKKYNDFFTSNLEDLEPSELDQPNSHLISWNRTTVAIQLLTGFSRIFGEAFRLLCIRRRVIRRNKETYEIVQEVNRQRIEKVLTALALPLGVVFGLFGMIPESKIRSILLTIFQQFLIKPGSKRLDRDWAFLISPKKIGLVMSNKGKLKIIPVTALIKLYHSLDASFPLAKISEFGNFDSLTATVRETGKST